MTHAEAVAKLEQWQGALAAMTPGPWEHVGRRAEGDKHRFQAKDFVVMSDGDELDVIEPADAHGIALLRTLGPEAVGLMLEVLREHSKIHGPMFTDEDGCCEVGDYCGGDHGISKAPWPCLTVTRVLALVEKVEAQHE